MPSIVSFTLTLGCWIERQDHSDTCTLTDAMTLRLNGSTVPFNDVPRDGKPQAQAAKLPFLLLGEAIEDAREKLRADAFPMVGDGDGDLVLESIDAHLHMTALRTELDCVREEVAEGLAQAGLVARNERRLKPRVEHDAFEGSHGLGGCNRFAHELRDIGALGECENVPVNKAGDFEHVVDETVLRLGTAFDILQGGWNHLVGMLRLAYKLGPAEDRRKRRAQFVRERCEEIILRPRCRLGRFPCGTFVVTGLTIECMGDAVRGELRELHLSLGEVTPRLRTGLKNATQVVAAQDGNDHNRSYLLGEPASCRTGIVDDEGRAHSRDRPRDALPDRNCDMGLHNVNEAGGCASTERRPPVFEQENRADIERQPLSEALSDLLKQRRDRTSTERRFVQTLQLPPLTHVFDGQKNQRRVPFSLLKSSSIEDEVLSADVVDVLFDFDIFESVRAHEAGLEELPNRRRVPSAAGEVEQRSADGLFLRHLERLVIGPVRGTNVKVTRQYDEWLADGLHDALRVAEGPLERIDIDEHEKRTIGRVVERSIRAES